MEEIEKAKEEIILKRFIQTLGLVLVGVGFGYWWAWEALTR